MATQDTPPLTDKELGILEQLWESDPDWAKDSLIVLRELRRLAGKELLCVGLAELVGWLVDGQEYPECLPQPPMEAIRTEDFFKAYDEGRALLPEEA